MPPRASPELAMLQQIDDLLKGLRKAHPSLSKPRAKKLLQHIQCLSRAFDATHAELSPVRRPRGFFDPSLPSTVGLFVSIALIAQDQEPLSNTTESYGSGVYAIYYRGAEPLYAGISGTQTPIYVGKADPKIPTAATPDEQGTQLFRRLRNHLKSIKIAEQYGLSHTNIPHKIAARDFVCRRLVCATNAQLVAERCLIDIFKPIWNSGMKICWGISKHGDASETRANRRSPWDVVHPGRAWAMPRTLKDAKTPTQIASEIDTHLRRFPPCRDREALVRDIVERFRQ
jgi:hypothetical protein